MLKRFLPLLLIAFLTGLLFRMGDQYGIPVLRMFGTQGIVVIGIWGAAILRGIQREDGIRRVEEGLKKSTWAKSVVRVGSQGRLPLWMVETPKGKILIGASDISNALREKRALKSLSRHAQVLLAKAYQEGATTVAEGAQAILVLLRKGVGGVRRLEVEDGGSVALVNPEGLEPLLADRSA